MARRTVPSESLEDAVCRISEERDMEPRRVVRAFIRSGVDSFDKRRANCENGLSSITLTLDQTLLEVIEDLAKEQSQSPEAYLIRLVQHKLAADGFILLI